MLYYEAKTGKIHQLDSLGGHPSGLRRSGRCRRAWAAYAAMPPSAIIPGFMPGLKAIHEKFATKPGRICARTPCAGRRRVMSSPPSSIGVNIFGEKFITYFPEGRDFYMPKGYFPNVGDLHAAGHGRDASRRARSRADYMITGPWAEAFVAKGNALGWKVTLDHMTETPPRWVEPLRFQLQRI
jgi:gamma-glutamyltranspeptidase/glutathione hydrolase